MLRLVDSKKLKDYLAHITKERAKIDDDKYSCLVANYDGQIMFCDLLLKGEFDSSFGKSEPFVCSVSGVKIDD
jgi:hypothetical protein